MDGQQQTTGGSLFRITEQQLQADEAAALKEEKDLESQDLDPVLSISTYVRKCFDVAKQAWENELHDRLLRCLRQKNGEYDPDVLAKIREAIPGGSENYRNITQIKTKAFEAWANASVFPVGDKCWTTGPTPDPELPEDREEEIINLVTEEVTQVFMQNGVYTVPEENIKDRILEVKDRVKKEIGKKAKLSAKRVELILDDQLTEGGYYEALAQCILDMALYPVCWLTGPEVRKRPKFEWSKNEAGENEMVVNKKIVREWRRVSPYNMFPSPNSKHVQDGYLCELIDLKRSELAAMIGVEGFNEPAIRKVLQIYGEGGLREWVSSDTERKDSEYKPHADDDPNPPIQAVVFWGECQGKMLIDWGMSTETIPDPDIDYQICAWLIGQYVVMARLNPSPLGTKPYYATSFDKINDSIIGNAIPEVMRDDQMRCCGAGRAIDNNMAVASGPMFEFYKNRFAPGTDFNTLIKPWAHFPTEDDFSGTNNPAVRVYTIPIIADVLMQIDEYFLRQAGEKTIPSYVYGNTSDKGGVLSTASGTSMMLNANLKNLQGAIGHLEKDIIIPSIKEHWTHVMLYDDDVEKFGDVNIVPKASDHLLVEEQRQLRIQELLDRVDRSQTLKAIVGDKGVANLLRETVKVTKIDPEEIVPSEEEMERIDQSQANLLAPLDGSPLAPVKSATVAPDGGQVGREPGRIVEK